MNKKFRYILYFVAIIVIIGLFFVFKGKGVSLFHSKKSKFDDYEIVNNANRFYSVTSIINKYVTSLNNSESDVLLNMLSEEYKKDNNITLSNVTNTLPSIPQNTTFVSKKMYFKAFNGSEFKFYVEGDLTREVLDEPNEVVDTIYFIVYIDEPQTLFAIEPYDGEGFKDGELK